MGLVLAGTSQVETEPDERAVDGIAYACAVVSATALMFWRRWIRVVVGVVAVSISVYLARHYPPGPAFLPVPLSMLGLGFLAPRRVAWLGVLALLALTTIGSRVAGESLVAHLLFFFGWGSAAVLAGQALAARGERAAAEREREAHAQEQALASERLRIAQDVHDSVAHAMATINVQSGVAAHVLDHKPEQAAVALEAIRTASRDALEELGSILGVLRDSDAAAPRSPIAGLDDISGLVDRARSDGVAITFDRTGEQESVPPTIATAAFRVVQEALTNTRRHASSQAQVAVTVAAGEDGSLRVTVRDDGGGERPADGAAVDAPSGGLGLVGMRERVQASGGTLTVGPASPAGFAVDAAWPDRASR